MRDRPWFLWDTARAKASPLITRSNRPRHRAAEPNLDILARKMTALIRRAAAEDEHDADDCRPGSCEGCRDTIPVQALVYSGWSFWRDDLHVLVWHREIVSPESQAALIALDVGQADPTAEETGLRWIPPPPLDERLAAAVASGELFASARAYLDEILAVAARQIPAQRRQRVEAAITEERDVLIEVHAEAQASRCFGEQRSATEELAMLADIAHQAIPAAGFIPSALEPLLEQCKDLAARRKALRAGIVD